MSTRASPPQTKKQSISPTLTTPRVCLFSGILFFPRANKVLIPVSLFIALIHQSIT